MSESLLARWEGVLGPVLLGLVSGLGVGIADDLVHGLRPDSGIVFWVLVSTSLSLGWYRESVAMRAAAQRDRYLGTRTQLGAAPAAKRGQTGSNLGDEGDDA